MIKVFDVLPSTNDYVKANFGALKNLDCVAARSQTAGKGRSGKSFSSPQGGLYFTVYFDNPSPALFSYMTALAAIAMRRVIARHTKKKVTVKWVNDVFIETKKVCGILAESVLSNNDLRVALGIGVNLFTPRDGFDKSIENSACALDDETVTADEFLTETLNELLGLFDEFEKNSAILESLRSEYEENSFLLGKTVTVTSGNKVFVGKVTGVNDKFNLLLDIDGQITAVYSGSVTSIKE